HGCIKREREQLLEPPEPRPGTRKTASPTGEPGEQHVRQRHADTDRDEHQEHHRDAAGQREPERRAHERRRARRRNDDREHPRAESINNAISARPSGDGGWRELAELEYARQVQREHEEQDRKRGDYGWRLQLEAPAEL